MRVRVRVRGRVRVRLCVRIVRTGQILAKIKKCKKTTFIDFDIRNLPATLSVLYSETFNYFDFLTYIATGSIKHAQVDC